MAQLKAPKLFDRIGSYWDSRTANGRDGLVLLDECIRRTASKDRDWDALARFVARANMSNNAAKVKKIIRAAFGNQIVFKLDKKHAAGGRFELKWEGPFNLQGSNTYSVVRKAIEQNKSWDDKAFLLELGKVLPEVVKPVKEIDDKEEEKIVAALAKKFIELQQKGVNPQDIVRRAQAKFIAEIGQPVKGEPAH